VLKSGDIGFGETYMAGQWDTPDLAVLLRLLLRNRAVIERLIHGHWAGRLLHRVRHWLNRNTRANSRKNIQAHYDLGNDFYLLWLDAGMNYSSAWFQGQPGGSLEAAQRAKLRRALQMAGLQPDRPGQRVLEIGCGWGALAQQAAHEFGAHVTGITLSGEQLAYAQQRLQAQGLAQRADLRLQDYRDLRLGAGEAPFDAICSIEMVEAVGRAYWPIYFDTVARLLKRGGRACIQSIVIRDERFGAYVSSTDFIQQHVFPGGCLPSAAEFRRQAEAAGLRVVDELAFGPDYAETCRRWHRAFWAHREAVRAQGFDARFERLWTFYLAYCEAGFDQGDIDVIQFTLEHAP
jgi:cyclopropane-fatty-acyl-phospholipid synthase